MLLLLGFDLAESSRLRFWPLKMLFELSLFEICAQVRDIEVIISLSLPLTLGFWALEPLTIEVWLMLPIISLISTVSLILIVLALSQKFLAQNLLLWSLVVPLIDASANGSVDIIFI
jgi:hypothetical protein